MNLIGSAVISNTHIREVSNLLFKDNTISKSYEVRKNRWNKEIFYTDLFAFIDCLILNDKLYTLPATIEGPKSTLWNVLVKEKIVDVIDTSGVATDVGKIIISRISQFDNFMKFKGSDLVIENDFVDKDRIINELEEFFNPEGAGAKRFFRVSDPYNFHIRSLRNILDSDDTLSDTIEDMARQLVCGMDYAASGAYQECTSVLRDMYYIISAEILEMPYYPQSTRVKFAEKFPNYFDVNFKTKLYTKIAEALNETISNVYDDFNDKIAFIPPFPSIVMDRSNSPEEIIHVALELRAEFEMTRRGFNNLAEERKNSKNLKARAKISRLQRELFEDASKSFDKLSKINIRSTIKYIPEMIKTITDPKNPTKYSSNLLMLPIELILDWWRRRPIHKMYSIKDKIYEIKQYHKLLEKLFPDEEQQQW